VRNARTSSAAASSEPRRHRSGGLPRPCALGHAAILPAPASTFRIRELRAVEDQADHPGDQKLTAATVTHNARMLVTRPWTFLDSGQCYPTPHSITLGEHMLATGSWASCRMP